MTTYKPKLIEVAMPLAAINAEATRDKSIRNHPQGLHRWWARRPLAVARAVIWASLVDDPSGDESLSPEEQMVERARLFSILEKLIRWENSNSPHVLREARGEIDRCFPEGTPPVLDPFGGGGAIPLEANRLGLEALSGDLNPVAVLIQKAMIEIPPRFTNRPPVHPQAQNNLTTWNRAQGLAADVDAYGSWMLEEVRQRIGHLYPKIRNAQDEVLTPIAWVWARTVKSPDPSWQGHVPLVGSWDLSKKPGKERVWVEPEIDQEHQTISYRVRVGGTPSCSPTMSGGSGICLATGAAITSAYIQQESKAGRTSQQLLAIVAQGSTGRRFLDPDRDSEDVALTVVPEWVPEARLPEGGLGFRVQRYGFDEWKKLFTDRQLVALSTFCEVLSDVHERVQKDAALSETTGSGARLRDEGIGSVAYADAIVTYLAFVIDKSLDFNCSLCAWDSTNVKIRNVFARQTLSMTWDYVECNLLGEKVGSFFSQLQGMARAIDTLPAGEAGSAIHMDARSRVSLSPGASISTDPPYYDNVGYSDLSDFFYVWLRRNLRDIWPDECATLLTPKVDEMIADPGRHSGRRGAEVHFETAMAEFMKAVAESQVDGVPATIYYAYKATETRDGAVRSTGWDTFLQAVVDAGLQVNATWPLRTELANRMRGIGANALASSIVLACRPRQSTAPLSSRGEFIAALRKELPDAVRLLQSGNIAPVDIAQSTIGPGIKVFSRYAKVVEADGAPMSVSRALSIINDVLGEVIDGEEAELDADTRFASTWYAQHGYSPGNAGDADSQARAKNTSLSGVQSAGIGEARSGKFRLFERSELDPSWSALTDARLTVWEATQHLVAALGRSESEASELLHQLGGYGDRARQLAYILFQKATEKAWAEEAGAYNGLILAWPNLQVAPIGREETGQQSLL